MRDKEFLNIQSALRTAVREPEAAPSALVTRTMRRREAVLSGREAEKILKQGEALPAEKVYDLAAASVLGRVALGKGLPDGKNILEMRQQLSGSSWFRNQFDGTAEDALRCLHNGTMFHGGTEKKIRTEQDVQKKETTCHQTPTVKGGS